MKRKGLIYLCASVIAVMTFGVSCVQDSFEETGAQQSGALTVDQAKQIFENKIAGLSIAAQSRSESGSCCESESKPVRKPLTPGEYTPIWEKAFLYTSKGEDYVVVPINAQYQYATKKIQQTKNGPKTYKANMSQRLVIKQRIGDTEASAYIQTLIPDKVSLKKKSFGGNIYTSQSGFTGVIIYHDLSDRWMSAELVKNGVMKSSLYKDSAPQVMRDFRLGIGNYYKYRRVVTTSGSEAEWKICSCPSDCDQCDNWCNYSDSYPCNCTTSDSNKCHCSSDCSSCTTCFDFGDGSDASPCHCS